MAAFRSRPGFNFYHRDSFSKEEQYREESGKYRLLAVLIIDLGQSGGMAR